MLRENELQTWMQPAPHGFKEIPPAQQLRVIASGGNPPEAF
jgi:hypothetical protein